MKKAEGLPKQTTILKPPNFPAFFEIEREFGAKNPEARGQAESAPTSYIYFIHYANFGIIFSLLQRTFF